MSTSSDASNPVELLAEEFLDRKRPRLEHPTLRECRSSGTPASLADEIRATCSRRCS